MKKLTLIFLILVAGFVTFTILFFAKGRTPLPEYLRRVIQSEAQKCATALVSKDYDYAIAHFHPKLINGIGGKEKVMEMLKRMEADSSKEEIFLEKVEIGEPDEPKQVGDLIVALVPETLTMKAPGGKLIGKSYLIAFSYDQGGKWVFIDSSNLTQKQLRKNFPELDGVVTLPEKKSAEFIPDVKP